MGTDLTSNVVSLGAVRKQRRRGTSDGNKPARHHSGSERGLVLFRLPTGEFAPGNSQTVASQIVLCNLLQAELDAWRFKLESEHQPLSYRQIRKRTYLWHEGGITRPCPHCARPVSLQRVLRGPAGI